MEFGSALLRIRPDLVRHKNLEDEGYETST